MRVHRTVNFPIKLCEILNEIDLNMAIAKKLEDEISRSSPSSSSSLNEALLFSTMCIIGLQVHVHISDGSVFSGIFYTISLENEFSIVLKNAKLTKKGRSKSNVASGKIVETLVILSSNIVQIVAEGASLSSNVAGEMEGENVVSAVGVSSETRSCIANKSIDSGKNRRGTNRRRNSAKRENRLENKARTLTSGKVNGIAGAMKEPGERDEVGILQNKHHPSSLNHQRQAGARILKHSKKNTDVHQEDNVEARSSSCSLDNMSERVKPMGQENTMPEPSSNGFHDAAERPSSTENSSSQSTTLVENSEMSRVLVASTNRLLPTQATDPDQKAKEFKLNPGAKTFSPSLAKRLTSAHDGMTPVVANMGYVPSNTPMLPVPEVVQPEIGVSPLLSHASSPSKFVPYTNLATGNTGGGSHFPQHMVGPTINRGQPHRFTTQYHSVQATPMLVNPNPQVMVGRSGQLMYMQPISQDLVQGAPHNSHLPPRPLFAPQHLQYPKHQSLIATGQPMQLYAPQPFAANGHQPYTVMPTDIPVMQPPFSH
ncbi:Ataxin 2 SM domain [Arabidopsis thaliana x Arabidopsis arenosa]|uniref:Ataxin 2 SM domain n=1 Tax=Arabidopsis thaliana x Arabidopsis arenosa TaxID=1240361 RepID=A0A8T1XSU0_9BRAS|nr:Ataxin 2 SM domain [Arabidopsis thaliana x Arabidopsis arenosa]